MITNCPGSEVAITIKECPKCGEEVELFTGDSKAKCLNCGHWVPREIASCIDWCPAAEQCYSHVFRAEKAAAAEEEGKEEGEESSV